MTDLVEKAARAQKESRELFFQRAAVADDPAIDSELAPLLWSTTLFPTNAYAQDAGMSLSDYSAFVVRACQLDQEDPVAFWQSLDRWQCELAEKLMIDEPVDVKARYFPAFAYNATGQYVSPTRILSGTEMRQAVNDG